MVIFTSIHTLAYPGAITRLKVVNHHLKSISNDMHLLSKLQVVDQFHIVVTPGLSIGLCPCAPQILDLDGNNLKFLPTCVSAMHLQTLSLKKVAHACASLTMHNIYIYIYIVRLVQQRGPLAWQNQLGTRSKHAGWLAKLTSALTPGTQSILILRSAGARSNNWYTIHKCMIIL